MKLPILVALALAGTAVAASDAIGDAASLKNAAEDEAYWNRLLQLTEMSIVPTPLPPTPTPEPPTPEPPTPEPPTPEPPTPEPPTPGNTDKAVLSA